MILGRTFPKIVSVNSYLDCGTVCGTISGRGGRRFVIELARADKPMIEF